MIARLGFALGVIALCGAAVSQLRANDALDFWREEWLRRQPAASPQPALWGAPPTAITVTPRSSGASSRRVSEHANGRMFCVRTCDGFYVPLTAGLSRAEARRSCDSICPGTETMVFQGGDGLDGIGEAVSINGKRYASLAAAFAYRSRVDNACRCGARPRAGLAQLRDDATLVHGDIVVTEAGVHVFTGRGRPPHDAGDFTPYREAGRVPGELRRYLSEVDRAYASAPERLAKRAAIGTPAADIRIDRKERRAGRKAARREAAREAAHAWAERGAARSGGETAGHDGDAPLPVLEPTAVTVGRATP